MTLFDFVFVCVRQILYKYFRVRFPAAADVVITVLLDVLARTPREDLQAEVLYLYLDNCSRENKNKYILAIGHLLVELGIFKRVKICFLPKGHTHSIVDAMFGCFKKPLEEADIFSWVDMIHVLRKAHTPMPEFFELSSIGNYSAKLSPCIIKKVTKITKPRMWKIARDNMGVVRHRYRRQLWLPRPTDKQTFVISQTLLDLDLGDANEVAEIHEGDKWMPWNTKGYIMFPHSFPDIFHKIVCVPPTPVNTVDLRNTISMSKFGKFFSSAQMSWWMQTLNEMESEQGVQCETCAAFRFDMKDNAASKSDNKVVKSTKRKAWTKSYKEMGVHLMNLVLQSDESEIVRSGHKMFRAPILEPNFLFVNGRYQSVHLAEFLANLNDDSRALYNRLDYLEGQGLPVHSTGGHSATSGPTERDTRRQWAGIEPGKLVIFRLEQTCREDPPWGVGLLLTVQMDPSGVVESLTYHRLNNNENECLPTSKFLLYNRNEIFHDAKGNWKPKQFLLFGQRASAGFLPVVETIVKEDIGSIAEWDEPFTILKKGTAASPGYTVKLSILKVLHDNERVNWKWPDNLPLPASWVRSANPQPAHVAVVQSVVSERQAQPKATQGSGGHGISSSSTSLTTGTRSPASTRAVTPVMDTTATRSAKEHVTVAVAKTSTSSTPSKSSAPGSLMHVSMPARTLRKRKVGTSTYLETITESETELSQDSAAVESDGKSEPLSSGVQETYSITEILDHKPWKGYKGHYHYFVSWDGTTKAGHKHRNTWVSENNFMGNYDMINEYHRQQGLRELVENISTPARFTESIAVSTNRRSNADGRPESLDVPSTSTSNSLRPVPASHITESPVSDFEHNRLQNIAANNREMALLGLPTAHGPGAVTTNELSDVDSIGRTSSHSDADYEMSVSESSRSG